jgi:hypothetical protein
MPTYQIEKVPHGRFLIALEVLFWLSLPIVFGADGAFMGGRAVRFFWERDRTEGRPPGSRLAGFTTEGEE